MRFLTALYVCALAFIPAGYAADIIVAPGGNLQAAIDSAQPNDNIILQAGATYVGNFYLRPKIGAGWITIRSSNAAALPVNRRVKPSDAANMARVLAPNAGAVFAADNAAHHYRLIGLELAAKPGIYTWNLICLGYGNETSLDQLPSDIELDRLYLHGDPVVGGKRGVTLNSKTTRILNSYMSDFKSTWQDAQAILGWNGPGPYRIQNNYLEASGENAGWGGAAQTIPGLVPSDISFLQNYCARPLSWRGGPWVIKNLFELKNARRVRMVGNVFENNWAAAQNGFAILFTVRTEYGRSPWNVIEDVTVYRNIIRHTGAVFNLLSNDAPYGGATRRILIKENVVEDVDNAKWGGNGHFVQLLGAVENVTVDHNTAFFVNCPIVFGAFPVNPGLVYTNNITNHNYYGIFGLGTGSVALDKFAPGAVVKGNVLAGGPAYLYPSGNFFPTTMADVGFTNMASGDYRLTTASPFKGAATDGKDLGADMMAVWSVTNGVVEGTPLFIP